MKEILPELGMVLKRSWLIYLMDSKAWVSTVNGMRKTLVAHGMQVSYMAFLAGWSILKGVRASILRKGRIWVIWQWCGPY